MRAKLIKNELPSGYFLYDEKGDLIASTIKGYKKQPLSLKNCQAIEHGYDLDELALEAFELDLNCQGDCNNYYERLAYKLGMIKMIGLLSDKKFSEEKMKLFAEYVWKEVRSGRMKSMDELFNDWTSPQQTEWDCIVEMEDATVVHLGGDNEIISRPKLDADGCLILKRI